MILAADFGGTNIKVGILQDDKILARSRIDALANQPILDRLEAVACEWESLLNNVGRVLKDAEGVGLALPFLTDPNGRRVLGEFGKFPGAAKVNFTDWCQNRLGLPIAIENDLRTALLGEWATGIAQSKNDVVMLAIGTGIGCAVISEGRLLRGANNRAAALLGHSTIAGDLPAGRCGNLGCAEDLASTATLATQVQRHPAFAGSKLSLLSKIDYESIFTLAKQGDECSQALLQHSLKTWAIVAQNAVLAYDPELVVLGGGVMRSHEIILPAMRQHFQKHMPGAPLQTPVVASVLGDDAALFGCEMLFKQTSSLLIT